MLQIVNDHLLKSCFVTLQSKCQSLHHFLQAPPTFSVCQHLIFNIVTLSSGMRVNNEITFDNSFKTPKYERSANYNSKTSCVSFFTKNIKSLFMRGVALCHPG